MVKLSSFIGSSLKEDGIAFALKDYLALADWTGRIVRDDKRGSIDASTPSILQELQLDEDTWMETVQGYSKGFHSFVGSEEQLKSLCQKQKKHWGRGLNACRKLFKKNVRQCAVLAVLAVVQLWILLKLKSLPIYILIEIHPLE